jgi:molecular chaperone IbpA
MNNLSVFGSALKDFDKFFVGFDEQFNRLTKLHDDLTKNVPSYPFYNIKKTGDSKYQIDLALAGWSKSELELELDKDKLILKL